MEWKFTSATEDDTAKFKELVGIENFITEEALLHEANCDWTRNYKGSSSILLKPMNCEQVSKVLAHCQGRNISVVPQGGNTGLVGGSVPIKDEVIVSLEKLNNIISFDEISGVVVCEAGCTLRGLNDFLKPFGFMVPLDLGPKDRCQIGGFVSTNAGGLRYIRYGSLHGSVLGLEVVLSDGTVLDLLSTLKKDNTGYDLKQIFIGAEGTLGIITKVSFLAVPKPSSVQLAFMSLESFSKVKATFQEMRAQFGEILSAVEMLDFKAMEIALKFLEGAVDPFPNSKGSFYILLETSGSNAFHDREKLDKFLQNAREKDLILEMKVAESEEESDSFWRIRAGLATALKNMGRKIYKYDLSLPGDSYYQIVEVMRERIGDEAEVVAWGHFGDGNIHLNIAAPHSSPNILEKIEPFVFEWTAENGGSISAEHGLGFMKPNAIGYSKKPEAVELMKKLKILLDPSGTLNPCKVLPK